MHSATIQRVIDIINTSPPTLFVLCGLPYSGKSFFARQVLTQTKCQYVAIDVILDRLGYHWESGHLPDADGWKDVFQISYDETTQALQDGKCVLYDSTNHTRVSRNTLKDVAKRAASPMRVIFLDTPAHTVRERWENNKITKERFILSEPLLEETIRAMERPTSEEDVITVEYSL